MVHLALLGKQPGQFGWNNQQAEDMLDQLKNIENNLSKEMKARKEGLVAGLKENGVDAPTVLLMFYSAIALIGAVMAIIGETCLDLCLFLCGFLASFLVFPMIPEQMCGAVLLIEYRVAAVVILGIVVGTIVVKLPKWIASTLGGIGGGILATVVLFPLLNAYVLEAYTVDADADEPATYAKVHGWWIKFVFVTLVSIIGAMIGGYLYDTVVEKLLPFVGAVVTAEGTTCAVIAAVNGYAPGMRKYFDPDSAFFLLQMGTKFMEELKELQDPTNGLEEGYELDENARTYPWAVWGSVCFVMCVIACACNCRKKDDKDN